MIHRKAIAKKFKRTRIKIGEDFWVVNKANTVAALRNNFLSYRPVAFRQTK